MNIQLINVENVLAGLRICDMDHLKCLASMEKLFLEQYVLQVVKDHLNAIESEIPPMPQIPVTFQ